MSWLTKIWNAKPAKKRLAPNIVARISSDDSDTWQDTFQTYAKGMMVMSAKYPFEWLPLIDALYKFEPNCRKHLLSTIALGNPGHDIEIDTNNEKRAKEALSLCNDLAARCYPRSSGADGLINGLLSQASRSGGMCCEWAPDVKITRVERAYLPPVRTIRFRRTAKNNIELGQLQNGEFVPLNPLQTAFHAIYFEDENPYPIPPVLAALQRLSNHKKIMEHVEAWFNKLSAMGFLSLVAERPESKGESEDDYRIKCNEQLSSLGEIVKENLSSGIVLSFDDMQATFNNTNAGAAGAKQIAQMVDEDMFAGLGRDPVMFGRSFSRTETWSKVAYEELTIEIKNIQRGAKRCLEHGHRLNLDLQGFGDCGVKVSFKPMRSLDGFRDAEAEKMLSDKIFAAWDRQLIDDERAKRLLGYEDTSANAGKFIASFNDGAYRLKKFEKALYTVDRNIPTHNTRNFIDSLPVFMWPIGEDAPRSTREAARTYLAEITAILTEAGASGVRAVYEWAMRHEIPFVEQFVEEALALYIEATESAISATSIVSISKENLTTIWKSAKSDSSVYRAGIKIEPKFDIPDSRAISYMSEKVDKMYISKFVSNSPQRSKKIQNWLQNQYIEQGLGVGRNPKQLKKFRDEFGDISDKNAAHAARIVIDTGVQRARNWGGIFGLSDEGFKEFRIAGPMDKITCKYCKSMVGRTFQVSTERTRIENIVDTGDEDISRFSPFITKRYGTAEGFEVLKSSSDEDIQAGGQVIPPFHPLCRHRIVAVV
jgi:hypothetical protein